MLLSVNSKSLLPFGKQMAMEGGKSFLPSEIIINILKRLPVKSLVRFQSVCKDWKNLFKTPSFVAEHFHHSANKNPFLLICAFDIDLSYFSSLYLLDYEMEPVEVQNKPSIDPLRHVSSIVGSCNGLLCVEVDYGEGRSSRSLWLWNPAIREVSIVPKILNDLWGVCCLGFGFSTVVNDYKIVRFYNQEFYEENADEINWGKIWLNRVEVYSLSTGSWKELEFGALQGTRPMSTAVNADGTMFWLGVGSGDGRHMVISFDIAMEVFTLIPIPTSTYNIRLIVYENKLAMFHSHYGNGNFESYFIDLWVMEEGTGECWTKKHSIGPISDWLYPICIWRNEIVYSNMESESEVKDDPKYFLYLFNLTTNEWKKLDNFSSYEWCAVFNYEESLVSVCNTHVG